MAVANMKLTGGPWVDIARDINVQIDEQVDQIMDENVRWWDYTVRQEQSAGRLPPDESLIVYSGKPTASGILAKGSRRLRRDWMAYIRDRRYRFERLPFSLTAVNLQEIEGQGAVEILKAVEDAYKLMKARTRLHRVSGVYEQSVQIAAEGKTLAPEFLRASIIGGTPINIQGRRGDIASRNIALAFEVGPTYAGTSATAGAVPNVLEDRYYSGAYTAVPYRPKMSPVRVVVEQMKRKWGSRFFISFGYSRMGKKGGSAPVVRIAVTSVAGNRDATPGAYRRRQSARRRG